MNAFAERLLAWAARHGRRDLPWQREPTPYRVWVSEIMLQQTQVATVLPYYDRFVARFPDVASLAAAPDDEVMRLWAGLGYYARARNLLAAARRVMAGHSGEFPARIEDVVALPGIGRSTAAAILALSRGERHAILDGNCKRVYARHAGIDGWPGERRVEARLWMHADAMTPHVRVAEYTQAVMDLGATVCVRTRPACGTCPVAADCVARATARTGELPAPRPRRATPLRRAALLVARGPHGEVLLERRPARGIWGGLWCAPLLEDERAVAEAVARYGVALAHPEAHDVVRHAFTHFSLDITPLVLRVEPRPTNGEGIAWVRPDALGDYGLPAPVRAILDRIAA